MIGERLAETRKDHGDKQGNLAQKLNVTVSAVRSWEQNKSSPSHETLVSICRLYGVSSDYLLGLSDEDPAYVRGRKSIPFSSSELASLRDYEEFLMWKRHKRKS